MNEHFMKDLVFLHKGESGNIEFAQFANKEGTICKTLCLANTINMRRKVITL